MCYWNILLSRFVHQKKPSIFLFLTSCYWNICPRRGDESFESATRALSVAQLVPIFSIQRGNPKEGRRRWDPLHKETGPSRPRPSDVMSPQARKNLDGPRHQWRRVGPEEDPGSWDGLVSAGPSSFCCPAFRYVVGVTYYGAIVATCDVTVWFGSGVWWGPNY